MATDSTPPAVFWFTGLPASGKSTLARRTLDILRQRGVDAELLDGDAIRELLPGTGFTREARNAHVERAALVAHFLEKHGVAVVVSLISPYRESRATARRLCKRFIEIHVATPLEECERRDPKGLYARARRGEIRAFTGVDDPYEAPENAELVLDTSKMDLSEAVDRITRLMGVPPREQR